MKTDDAATLLEESEPGSFHFDEYGITWRGHRLDLGQLTDARQFAVSFGSCSFREPMDDLHEIHLVAAGR
jgi:hypothetical protein